MELQLSSEDAEYLRQCIGKRISEVLVPSNELDFYRRTGEASVAIVRFDDGSALTFDSMALYQPHDTRAPEVEVFRLYIAVGEEPHERWPGGPLQDLEIASPLEQCFGKQIVDIKVAPSTQLSATTDSGVLELLGVDGGLFMFLRADEALEFDVASTMPEAISVRLRGIQYLATRRDLVPLAARRIRLVPK